MAETLSWVDVDGVEHDLSDANGARALRGVEGRFMPPVALVEEEIPFQPGAYLRHVKTLVREVAVPVLFRADDATALRAAVRQWLYDLHVDRGPGQLRVTGPAGTTRDLSCIYAGGMEIVESDDTAGDGWQKAVLVFRAHDPYWYDRNETTQTFELDATQAPFFPFFPMVLTSSEFFGQSTVVNDGDVDAWPTWVLTGPGDDPALRNLTTGKTLELGYSIPTGESVEVDTRPGIKTVVDQDGNSLYASMEEGSALWPLVRGPNALSVELAAATAETSVVLRYRRRFLGA